MATVIGGSGALRMIEERLREVGMRETLDSVARLAALEKRLQNDFARARRQAEAALELNRALANARFLELARGLEVSVNARRREIEHEIAGIDARLARRPSGCNLLFLPIHALDRTLAQGRRRGLARAPDRLHAQLSAERDLAWLELQRLHLNGDAEVERAVADSSGRVALVAALRSGPEARGAGAEEAVIERLADLPEGYHVLNDVTVRPREAVCIDGVWRQTAQLDHVVVGPAGVFVVETKNWSREFAARARAQARARVLSPQRQVDAAARLCFRLLRDAGFECRVRSIVACLGSALDGEPELKVKVLSLNRLEGYIRWFERKGDVCDVQGVLRCLRGCQAA